MNFLLVYDRAAGMLVHEQVFESSTEALAERFRLERRHREQLDNIEIVVIGAESREALMRTHARYFLSLEELAGLLVRSV